MIKVETKMTWRGNELKLISNKCANMSVEEIAIYAVSNMVTMAPRDTGHLAASINYQMSDRGSELQDPSKYGSGEGENPYGFQKLDKPASPLEALVGTNLNYSEHVEYGTIKMPAQPFARPAIDMVVGNALNIIELNGKKYFAEYLNARDVFLIMNK